MLRTVNDQPTLWDAILPPELLVLPVELGRVEALLDDPEFFAPFTANVRSPRASMRTRSGSRLAEATSPSIAAVNADEAMVCKQTVDQCAGACALRVMLRHCITE